MKAIAIFSMVVFSFFALNSSAQTLSDQFLYDFSNNADTQRSELHWVIAENDYMIVAGNKQHNGSKATAFVAKIGWDGMVIWQKDLSVPIASIALNTDGGKNLVKMPDGTMILGGISLNTAVLPGDTVGLPYIYRFNSDGDSLGYQEFPDTVNKRFGALLVEADGGLIISAITYRKDYSPTSFDGRPWIAMLSSSGSLVWENQLTAVFDPKAQFAESLLRSNDGTKYEL